ncbi:MAG: ATP-binding protein [Desulfobacterales bacterium]
MKWLILGRFLFAVFLLCSTLVLMFGNTSIAPSGALFFLFILIFCLFLLSLIYYILLKRCRCEKLLAYVQVIIDSLFVSMVIHVTGGYASIFPFIYMVVIVYSSILLYRKGSFLIAAICSLQYAALLLSEYFGIFNVEMITQDVTTVALGIEEVLQKVMITTGACFAVAFLSSILAEQAKASKDELTAMEEHVKRVEKMAYMGEMAAHLAHEIKNPLASLSGSIQLLREEITYNSDHDKLMQIVLRETDRLSTLVTNFLLFARPRAGHPENMDLEKTLSEFVQFFNRNEFFTGRITVKTRLTSGIRVVMDPFHLRQILLNLMINAAEAINETGAVELAMYPVKPNLVEVSVTDDGCGIPGELLNAIFDPFFTTKANGTGLGLSIVHTLLEMYDSRLDVSSRSGHGTQIRFRLKQSEPDARPS